MIRDVININVLDAESAVEMYKSLKFTCTYMKQRKCSRKEADEHMRYCCLAMAAMYTSITGADADKDVIALGKIALSTVYDGTGEVFLYGEGKLQA